MPDGNITSDLTTKIIEALVAVIAGLTLLLAKLRASLKVRPSDEHLRRIMREEIPPIMQPMVKEAVASAFRDHLIGELRDEVMRMRSER